MNETPNNPVGGLPKNFNLGAILNQTDDVDLYAVKAAQNMFDEQQSYKAAAEAADIDEKTGLLVQNAWMENLNAAIVESDNGASLRAYVADLNGFKAVNDSLGHAKGDELLSLVATAFKSSFMRSSDVIAHGNRESVADGEHIARLGGDEFAVYTLNQSLHAVGSKTPRVNPNEPIERAAQVNKTLDDLLVGTEFERFDISLAIGSAEHEPGETVEALFARADMAMFEVKYGDKLANVTGDDLAELEVIIPYMESLGLRVENWIKAAVADAKTARDTNPDQLEFDTRINRAS